MTIEKEVFEKIIFLSSKASKEVGGIIGGKDNCISYFAIDEGIHTNERCIYKPNVIFLNEIINDWEQIGIDFYGLFHTHRGGGSLSEKDIRYIKIIMNSMPNSIKELFFPVINCEEKTMIIYMAENKKEDIEIKKINYEII